MTWQALSQCDHLASPNRPRIRRHLSPDPRCTTYLPNGGPRYSRQIAPWPTATELEEICRQQDVHSAQQVSVLSGWPA